MKKTLSVLIAVLVLTASLAEVASAHHQPRRPGYSDGFLDGLLVSTAAILLSHTISHEHYKQLVMMGADEEAAVFMADDHAEPSALLREAMKLERELAEKAGSDAQLSDEDLAYLIMKRAASL